MSAPEPEAERALDVKLQTARQSCTAITTCQATLSTDDAVGLVLSTLRELVVGFPGGVDLAPRSAVVSQAELLSCLVRCRWFLNH